MVVNDGSERVSPHSEKPVRRNPRIYPSTSYPQLFISLFLYLFFFCCTYHTFVQRELEQRRLGVPAKLLGPRVELVQQRLLRHVPVGRWVMGDGWVGVGDG